MRISSINQTTENSGGAGLRCPSKGSRTAPKQATTKAMTLFVNVASMNRKITVSAPETSQVQQLKQQIYKKLGIPEHVQSQLLLNGRALTPNSATLKAMGVTSFATLTLACGQVLGGSRSSRLINESDSDDDDNFQMPVNLLKDKASTSKIDTTKDEFVKQTNQSTVGATGNVDSDFNKEGGDTELHRANTLSQTTFGASDSAGLSYEWADTVKYAMDLLKNPMDGVFEMVRNGQSIKNARAKLTVKHGIPKLNEALEAIASTIPELKSRIESIGIDEPRFNHDILDFYLKFDQGNKGYLDYNEFSAYIAFICKELGIPMDEKTL